MNKEFEKNNYIVIRQFLDAARAEELALLYMNGEDPNVFVGDIDEAPKAIARYNYKHFLHLLCERTGEISKLYGSAVLPTYAYSRWYKDGDSLAKHSDRPSCEVSVTVNLKKDKDWPIYIETPNGETRAVELEPGDAMMYRGCIAPHWRDTIGDGNCVQVFLHYVDIDGDNRNHYFDRMNFQSLCAFGANI